MADFWEWLGNTELAFQIGATWWFPLFESIHVLFVVTLVGSIAVADLRALGLMGLGYRSAEFVRGLTRVAWISFVPAVVTGLGLFISRPGGYAENRAFQIKITLLLLAGLNVWFYHRFERNGRVGRQKLCAVLSLGFWIGIVFSGRWVGHISG
ncbi:MAG: hypothetical protein VYE04_04225 [Pseudomonadota bacterium]|nr:hypothetical protein [Pseudomonadota bacterium]